jgi:hypothetical protein
MRSFSNLEASGDGQTLVVWRKRWEYGERRIVVRGGHGPDDGADEEGASDARGDAADDDEGLVLAAGVGELIALGLKRRATDGVTASALSAQRVGLVGVVALESEGRGEEATAHAVGHQPNHAEDDGAGGNAAFIVEVTELDDFVVCFDE